MNDITNERINKYEKININFLNTLDLCKYVENETDVSTIITNISNDYDDSPNLPSELQGCIFNFLDNYTVAKYLAKRYNFAIQESIIYTFYPKSV